MPFSEDFKTSATLFAKQIKLDRLAKGLPIFDGGLGENPLPAPESLKEAVKSFCHLKEYTDVKGVEALRSAICNAYFQSEPESSEKLKLVLGNGLKPLLYLVQLSFTKLFSNRPLIDTQSKAMADPFVVVHVLPAWTSYIEQMKIIQGNLDNNQNPNYLAVEPDYLLEHTTEDADSNVLKWAKVAADQFESQLNLHFKRFGFVKNETSVLVLFNNPNNPSGCVYNEQELHDYAKVFREFSAVILADDIYGGLIHESSFNDREQYGGSIRHCYPEGTILGSSLSKNWACGGYRLGWIAFPLESFNPVECYLKKTLENLYNLCVCLASSLYSCPSMMLQYVAAEALTLSQQELDPSWIAKHIDEVQTNDVKRMLRFQRRMFEQIVSYCKSRLSQMKIRYSDSKAAWYILMDFEFSYGSKLAARGVLSSEQLCGVLCEEVGFITVSGENFGIAPHKKNYLLRYSFVDIRHLDIWANGDDDLSKGYDTENIEKGFDALHDWLRNL